MKISPQTLEIHRGEKAIVKVTIDERTIADLRKNQEPKVHTAKFDKQVEAAADILVKVTDGILAKGDKRLKFKSNNSGGGMGLMGAGTENDYRPQ